MKRETADRVAAVWIERASARLVADGFEVTPEALAFFHRTTHGQLLKYRIIFEMWRDDIKRALAGEQDDGH